MSEKETWVAVLSDDKLKPGEVGGAKVGEIDIAIYNIDGKFYATDNICSHAHALLSDGFLDGDVIECPLHGGAFEVKTGKPVLAPACANIKTFPVRISGNQVQVRVD
jgi:nitrite reductase/ring-hydroxylating ferredoxin subunit